MNPDYTLACGILWHKTADPEAGWELVESLESPDLNVRALARALLIDGEEDSLRLLESALTTGVVSSETAWRVHSGKSCNNGVILFLADARQSAYVGNHRHHRNARRP